MLPDITKADMVEIKDITLDDPNDALVWCKENYPDYTERMLRVGVALAGSIGLPQDRMATLVTFVLYNTLVVMNYMAGEMAGRCDACKHKEKTEDDNPCNICPYSYWSQYEERETE